MITEEDLVRLGSALSDRFGVAEANAFGRDLPGLVDRLSREWDLDVEGALASGASSVALIARSALRGPTVLKISPDTAFLAIQVTMLRHLAPTGRVPLVHEADERAGAVLMERVLPGEQVDGGQQLVPPPEEWAALLHDLHGVNALGVAGTLTGRCEEMIVRIGDRQRRPAVRTHVPDELWERAVADCRDLLRTTTELAPIHGDLHLGNVLRDSERGLVAIDPKLCLGDRSYDVMDYVIHEGGSPADIADRAATMAELTGLDPGRVNRWCRIDATVTAVSLLAWYGPSERTESLLSFAKAL